VVLPAKRLLINSGAFSHMHGLLTYDDWMDLSSGTLGPHYQYATFADHWLKSLTPLWMPCTYMHRVTPLGNTEANQSKSSSSQDYKVQWRCMPQSFSAAKGTLTDM
jgi:hypothetical protein